MFRAASTAPATGGCSCNSRPAAADAAALAGLYRRWREDLLPAYRNLVTGGDAEVHITPAGRLVDLVDEVTRTAGVHLWYLAVPSSC